MASKKRKALPKVDEENLAVLRELHREVDEANRRAALVLTTILRAAKKDPATHGICYACGAIFARTADGKCPDCKK